ncbi:MAG: hypothetical protein Fur009_5120 [Candidatus Microgenomates bacterium]
MRKKFLKIFFTLLFFLIIFFVSIINFLLKSDLSFTTLSYFYGNEIFINKFKNPLKKGEKIIGEFKAKENNLGIISIAFDPYYKTWDDIIFRLKEKESNKWYYEKKYWANQFLDFEFFSFGFPIISNSKDKIYIFEIESLVANNNEGFGIRNRFPSVVIKYKFEKNELLANKKNLILFFIKKVVNNLKVPDFLFIFVISLLPLLFYILNLFRKNVFFKEIIIFCLFVDLFLIRNLYIFIFTILSFLIYINFKILNLLILIIGLIILMPIIDVFGYSYLQYKISIYFYINLMLFLVKYFLKKIKR